MILEINEEFQESESFTASSSGSNERYQCSTVLLWGIRKQFQNHRNKQWNTYKNKCYQVQHIAQYFIASWGHQADAGFLCDKVAVVIVAIKERLCRIIIQQYNWKHA